MFFFFQAEHGIRDLVRSRGLGDVYKRQVHQRWRAASQGDAAAALAGLIAFHLVRVQRRLGYARHEHPAAGRGPVLALSLLHI